MRRTRPAQLDDPAWVRDQYELRGKAYATIASEIGTSAMTVRAAVLRHGIKTRTSTEQRRAPRYPQLADAAWLHTQYVDEGRGSTDLGNEIGCSEDAVKLALRRHNIPVRSQREARQARSRRYRALVRFPEAADLYLGGRSCKELAEIFGVDAHLVREELEKHGVTIRPRSESTRIALSKKAARANIRAAADMRRRPSGPRQMKKLMGQRERCMFCGDAHEDIQLHHLNADRADDRTENLAPLCELCHRNVEWFIHHATDGLRRIYYRK